MTKPFVRLQTANRGSADALPLDVLRGMVGGAGAERRQSLTDEVTASFALAEDAKPAEVKQEPLSDEAKAKIQTEFREDAGSKPDVNAAASHAGSYTKSTENLFSDSMPKEEHERFHDIGAKRLAEIKESNQKAIDVAKQASETAAKRMESAASEHAKAQAEADKARSDAQTLRNQSEAFAKDYRAQYDAIRAAQKEIDSLKREKAGESDTRHDARINELGSKIEAAKKAAYEASTKTSPLTRALVQAADKAGEKAAKAKEAAQALDLAKDVARKTADTVKDLTSVDPEMALKKALKTGSQQDLKKALGELPAKAWAAGVDALHDGFLASAKQAAKAAGTYSEASFAERLSGSGINQVTTTGPDGSTEKTTTISQVMKEGSASAFSADGAVGAEAKFGLIAEAGKKAESFTKGADGKDVLDHSTKTIASAGITASAGASVSPVKAMAEAAAKIALHAEAEAKKNLGGDVIVGANGTAHAEAAAKAGASIGFDGAGVKAGASAEATAKASGSVEYGIAKIEGGAFATAKAEAKADYSVSFDPRGKIGAKMSYGAEASAGVGAEGKIKLAENLEVGGGVSAGKIGVKADVDVGYKDGSLNAAVDFGAALGIGFNVKVNISLPIEKPAIAIADAAVTVGKAIGSFFSSIF